MKKYIGIVCIVTNILMADSTNDLHNYMWANYHQFSGNAAQAQQWYNKVIDTDHSSIFSNKGYLHFLYDRGECTKIVAMMPKLEKSFEKDPDLQLIFVMALKKTNCIEKADEKLITLSREFKNHPEIIFHAAETFVRRKETSNALSLIDDFLNNALRRPNNFIFYFLKAQIYMQLQDLKQARTNIQQCLESHPRFPQAWLLLAMLEEQSGQINDAMKGFTSYLEIAGPNKQIEQHLLALAVRQKSATENRQLLFVNKSCFSKAMLLFDRKEYKAALQQIEECLATNPSDPQLRLLKVQALTALEQFDELIKIVVAWINQEPDNQLWLQTVHLLPRAHVPLIRVINALNTIHTQHPKKLLPLLYLADLLTRNNDTSAAIACHQKTLPLIQDPTLKARVLYQIALLQYENYHYDNMITTLNDLDTVVQNHAPGNNLRAYYYATTGNDLKKAQYYFDKAYSADRGNPHYLDTQAVIYYKQQQYDKAVGLLQPLSESLPEDSSILIHLAKSLYKLGKKDDAKKTIVNAQKYAYTPYEKKITNELITVWNRT